jgi:hypothetical protein
MLGTLVWSINADPESFKFPSVAVTVQKPPAGPDAEAV